MGGFGEEMVSNRGLALASSGHPNKIPQWMGGLNNRLISSQLIGSVTKMLANMVCDESSLPGL